MKLLRLALLCITFLCSSKLIGQIQSFRFAFFTDLHVGTPTGAEDLSCAIRDVNARKDLDFVWVNGDITELGTNTQLDEAKRILDSLTVPYYVVEGNHETKWSESGNTYFSYLFGSNKQTFEYKGVRFIGLSSGPVLRMGDGHVSPFDISWLQQTLEGLKDKNVPIIFCTHYPLNSELDNSQKLLDIIRPYNVMLTLCGHGHANKIMSAEGIPNIMCRSLLRAKAPKGGYTIIDVSPETIRFYEKQIGAQPMEWYNVPTAKATNSQEPAKSGRKSPDINTKYPNVTERWAFKTDGMVISSAAQGEQKVVVGDETGKVYCLDLNNGRPLWTFYARNAVYSTPAIANGKVVFGSCDGSIYCLQLHDGKKLWEYKTNHTVMGTPLINNNTVYIGGTDGCYRSLNLTTGKLNWQFCELKGYVESSPILYNGKLIFGAWDTYLYALNSANGKLVWKWTNGASMHMSPAACKPVAANGKVFVVAPDRYMTALSVETGEIVWRSSKHRVRESIGISGNGESVYARCFVDTLFAVSSKPDMYNERWVTLCGYDYDINPSMIVECAGRLYFATKNGVFIAIDATTGKLLWQHKYGNTMVSTLVPIREGKKPVQLVFTTHDGVVGVLEDKL